MGFTYRFYGVWGKHFQIQCLRKNVQVDVFFYFRRGDQRITHGFDTHHIIAFSYPARLLETLAPVDFYGKTFMAPKHKEAVLTHQYGDWKIRRTDWDWRTSPPQYNSDRNCAMENVALGLKTENVPLPSIE